MGDKLSASKRETIDNKLFGVYFFCQGITFSSRDQF